MVDFATTDYLAFGNKRQVHCFALLKKYHIMSILVEYSPVVVGTIPINIDIASSDIDIICECKIVDFDVLKQLLSDNFGDYEVFCIARSDECIVCRFMLENQLIEVYVADIPVYKQNAYRHMLIEHRILNLLGEDFRGQVIERKSEGLKTEPAFAQLLGLVGNPFTELLKLESYSDRQIIDLYPVK